jgi:hypothetical protein
MSDSIKTAGVKEAALYAILKRLQEIDENEGSRSAFVGSLTFQMMHGLSYAIFASEIDLMQRALGIEPQNDKDKKIEDAMIDHNSRQFQMDEL